MAQPKDQHNLNYNKCTTTTISKSISNRKRTFDKVEGTNKATVSSNFSITRYLTLETINDDCLRHIVQYLSIMDCPNFSATCSRFHNFAEAFIYPKKIQRICITYCESGRFTATLVASLDNANSSQQLKLNSFDMLFSRFGEFVNDLTFDLKHCPRKRKNEVWRTVEKCRNLTTLRLKHFQLVQADTRTLQFLIEKIQNFKELNFINCTGLTNNWCSNATSNTVPKVDKLSLSGAKNIISNNFYGYFRNLSSLYVFCDHRSVWQMINISRIFDNNGHSLKNLKLQNLSAISGYETIGILITEKLRILESVGLGFELTENSKHLIELPHLTSLVVWSDSKVNAALRILNDNGIIEELTVFKGVFEYEDENAPPFIFNKLKSFCWKDAKRMSRFLKTLNKADMPVIHTLELKFHNTTQNLLNELVKFIEAKHTLKSILLYFHGKVGFVLIDFIRKIINILRVASSPKRLFLNLKMWYVELGAEEVRRSVLLNLYPYK